VTAEDLRAFRDAENRKRMSRVARVITGLPDRRTVIRWQEVALAGRAVHVRVYRPSAAARRDDLPLVLHVHGGGFVGTAVQSDWVNSHLAARLPAVVGADSPTLTRAQMDLFLRLAVPEGTDARPLSPLYADDLGALAPEILGFLQRHLAR
jgi:acetyl esterase/lipase